MAVRDETNIRLRRWRNVKKTLVLPMKNTPRVSTQHVSVCTFETYPWGPAPRAHVETTRRRVEWTHHTHHTPHNTTRRQRQRKKRRRKRRRQHKRREKIHFKCGGAWPFFVDGVLFLVNPVCARDLCLLNSVKYDLFLISFSASWPVHSFFNSANYLFYAVAVFNFSFLKIYLCTDSFENFPKYLVLQLRN